MSNYIATAELTRLRVLASEGNLWAQRAAASYMRMMRAPAGSKLRRHHRRSFRRHAQKALANV